ncbi:MscL family protein [Gordonia phthalatica]|nr:MscL family protein [Gordonia phthalatica]
MRGNVVELATAVIVGAAFTAIVTAFTDKIINPLIAVIPTGDCPQTAEGSNDFVCGFGFAIDSDKPATFLDFGAVISAFINFVIVAAVVYFLIVVPYNKLQELRKLEDGEDDPDEEIVLLTQIRNALDPEAKARDAAEKAKVEAEKAAEEARQRGAQAPAPVAAPAAPQQAPAPGYGDRTQTMQVPPQQQGYQGQQGQPQAQQGFNPPAGPPTGGFPTPNPAPGEYPPPGNLPPGQYAPGQYPPAPGQDPGDAPRHGR